MTEKTPIDEAEEIAAARLLVADGWRPHTLPIRRGLDVRDWTDCVRVLLQAIAAAEARAEAAQRIIAAALNEAPVGYLPKHTADNLPNIVADLAKSAAGYSRDLDEAEARAKKCEDDWNLDLLKHTTQIRAERDAAVLALKSYRTATPQCECTDAVGCKMAAARLLTDHILGQIEGK